jgi:hypothetical protein
MVGQTVLRSGQRRSAIRPIASPLRSASLCRPRAPVCRVPDTRDEIVSQRRHGAMFGPGWRFARERRAGASFRADRPATNRYVDGSTLKVRTSRLSGGTPGAISVAGLLVEAEDVPGWIPEPRGDLWCVDADRLDDLAAVGEDCFDRRGNAVDHDVDQQTWLGRRRSTVHPSSAHLTRTVVESGVSITPLSDLPAEDCLVESRGASDVDRRNLGEWAARAVIIPPGPDRNRGDSRCSLPRRSRGSRTAGRRCRARSSRLST